MAAGINYFRLLWNLYRQKRNVGRTKEQIGRLQKKKLEKLLLFAYEKSPYYRKAFEAEGISPENIRTTPLENFPVLDKGILMENFDELVTDRSLKQEKLLQFDENSEDDGENYLGKYHVVHSSGSTGTPRYFIYDNAAWEQMLVGIIRGALWGMSMGSVLKLLAERPRILYIAATDGRYGGAMAVGDGIRGVRAEQRFLDINTPLAKSLKLVNCTMEDTDLSFEYSDVEADVKGHIISVKNPRSGHIIADSVGEIIRGDAVMECTGEVILREEAGESVQRFSKLSAELHSA